MADQQNQPNQQRAKQPAGQGQDSANPDSETGRSENLLPAGEAGDTADGRFEVAEEVNLDQQSDSTRRVGQTPKGIASDALADTLKPDAPGRGA